MVMSLIKPLISRGISSLAPLLMGGAYTASQKPEGIEEVFKSAIGMDTGFSKLSDSLTKETNVKKVADRLKAAGVDPATAEKLAQGAIGTFGDAVIGDDEADTIAQEVGKGLEGGKPSGSAMIDFEGIQSLVDTPSGTFSAPDPKEIEEQQKKWRELGKQITLPSDTLPQIVSTPEPEELPNITSNPIPPEEKVSVGDIGFTPTAAPTLEDSIITMALGDDYEKVGVIVQNPRFKKDEGKRKLLESIGAEGEKGKFVAFGETPEDITDRVFEQVIFKANPTKNKNGDLIFTPTVGKALNELDPSQINMVNEATSKETWKTNRMNGGQFTFLEAPDEIKDLVGKNLTKESGILSTHYGKEDQKMDHVYAGTVIHNGSSGTVTNETQKDKVNKESPFLMPTTTGERQEHNVVGFIKMKGSSKAIHPYYDKIVLGQPTEIERLNPEYDELYDPIKNVLKENDIIYSTDDVKDKKLQEKALDILTNQIINTNIVNSNTLNTFLRKPDYLLTDAAREYIDYINEKLNPNLYKTNSGVTVDFGNQKARNKELGIGIKKYFNETSYKYDGDKTIFDVFGDPAPIEGQDVDPRFLFGYRTESGAKGYAYGFLTDRDIAFVDQLTTVKGSLSPTEYKEIKDILKEYTGASKVAGIRVSGAREGLPEEAQTTVMKAAGGIVDKPLYDRY